MQQVRVCQLLLQVVTLGLLVLSSAILWKGLVVATGCELPIIVMLSSEGSAFNRGDLLFLSMSELPIRVGEIVVFKADKPTPIVHRVMKVHERPDGEVDLMTKGDDNTVDDRGLYPPGQQWLNGRHIIGRVKGYLPYIGIITIIMNEFPLLKFLIIIRLVLIIPANYN